MCYAERRPRRAKSLSGQALHKDRDGAWLSHGHALSSKSPRDRIVPKLSFPELKPIDVLGIAILQPLYTLIHKQASESNEKSEFLKRAVCGQ